MTMTTGSFYNMPYSEQYSTIGGTADIKQVDAYLEWEVDRGGAKVVGRTVIGDQGMNAALHQCRASIDKALLAPYVLLLRERFREELRAALDNASTEPVTEADPVASVINPEEPV